MRQFAYSCVQLSKLESSCIFPIQQYHPFGYCMTLNRNFPLGSFIFKRLFRSPSANIFGSLAMSLSRIIFTLFPPFPERIYKVWGAEKNLLFSFISCLTEEAKQKINEVWFAWNCAFGILVLNKSTDILWVLSCLVSTFNSSPCHLLLN